MRYGLSAGRVQSVAVRLVVDREKERQAFHPEEYWEIGAQLRSLAMSHNSSLQTPDSFQAKLLEKDEARVRIGNKEDSDRAVEELEKEEYRVSRVEKSDRKRHPYPPYTTSTLQQAGVNVLGFSSKRTMRVAQALYEAGLITYHRTDSTVIGEKALGQIRDFIGRTYGSNYLPADAIRYKTKVRLAQEAHEAIRPTDVGLNPPGLESSTRRVELEGDEKKVYELVWRQTVASQMLPAVYEQISADIKAGSYLFRATGSKLIFDGWEKLNKGEDARSLPELKEGEKLQLMELVPSQHFTEPPARYTEATLIKKLEEEGVGRPSTYAPIISTIQGRGYVSLEGRALKPEDSGVIVNDKILVPYFPDVVDLSFTAKMEESFDEIARGEKNWVELIRGFYGPFSQELEKAEENIDKSSMTTIAETDEKCPDSGHPLVIKLGRYGRFYSCTGFPECKYARPYIEKIGMKCPDCKEGEVIIRRTHRGKTFYGCSRYPDCKFASWKDPREESKK